MNRFPLVVAILVLASACEAKSQVPKTDDEKTLYALGATVGKNLAVFNLTKEEFAMVLQGMTDAHDGVKPAVDPNEFQMKIRQLAQKRGSAKSDAEKAKGEQFLAKTATESGVVKTPSGLLYRETQGGTGDAPGPTDHVKVNYRGTLIDGTEFDSSAKHGDKPAEFPLNGVVPCWTEGIQKMKVGGKAKLYCPSSIAYGDRPPPGGVIQAGSTLIFDVDLLEVTKAAPGAAPMPPMMGGAPGMAGGPGIAGHPPFGARPGMPAPVIQPGARPPAPPAPISPPGGSAAKPPTPPPPTPAPAHP